MPDSMFVTGIVGTPPAMSTTRNGMTRLQFRLGSNQRRYNKETGAFEYGDTNWYTVVAFRRLAENTERSIHKNDRVMVLGKLKIDEWEKDGQPRRDVELLADAIGHDLMFGTATFVKSASATTSSQQQQPDVSSSASGIAGFSGESVTTVDANGWAFPGGRVGGDGPAANEASDGASGEDRRADDGAAAAEREFASAEPAF